MHEILNLKERKRSIITNLKKYKETASFLGLLVLAFIGFKIRILNLPLLKNVVSGKYVVVDPDAAAFLRYAKYILENGSLMKVDLMRYFPLGYNNLDEFNFLSHFIVYLYKFLHFFNSSVTIEFADVIFPPAVFSLTLIPFYFLVKKLFNYKVALLSSAFLIAMPNFLYRTMAGVGDKEALAILFFFCSLYFFIAAINSEEKYSYFYGILAGLTTAILGAIWGGVNFIFLILGLYILIKIVLNALDKKELYSYIAWWFTTFILLNIFYNKVYGFKSIVLAFTSQITLVAMAAGVIFILLKEYNFFNLKNKLKLDKYPLGLLSIFSMGVAAFVFIPLGLTFYYRGGINFYFNFIFVKGINVITYLIKPFSRDRWTITVVENVQPFIEKWVFDFGSFYFLLFFVSSILIFYEIFKNLKKHKLTLTSVYTFFIFGFIFNRYSPNSILNGSSAFSKFLYFGSIVGFVIVIFGYFLYSFYRNSMSYKDVETETLEENKTKEQKEAEIYNLKLSKDKDLYNTFTNLNKTHLFLLLWFIILIFSARSAERFVFILVPATCVLVSYFLVKIIDFGLSTEDKFYKVIALLVVGILIFAPFVEGSLVERLRETISKSESASPVFDPQWQKGMAWVLVNTSKNSVFAQWWDYGYWIQTFGERATLSDGGNARGGINYLIGRHLLTGQNRTEALELLKTHNATHFLISSGEIGKYGAFSSIGSDEENDRFSSVNPFIMLPKETLTEKKDDGRKLVTYFYIGDFVLDDDFIYNRKLFPENQAVIKGLILTTEQKDNKIISIKQPSIVIFYRNIEEEIPLSCVFLDGQEYIFDSEDYYGGCFRIIPVVETGSRIKEKNINYVGGALFLSPKTRNTLFTQLYLFDKNEENDDGWKGFRKVYDDSSSGYTLAFYPMVGRIIGPIKIWEVEYSPDIKQKLEYLQ